MSVQIAILAAGASSRMGSPKQLIDWAGQPLLRHLTMQACGTDAAVTVILGSAFECIHSSLAGLPVTVLENRDWAEGMSSSIRLAALSSGADALLLMACDQPYVTTATLQALIRAHEADKSAPVIASEYAGTLGVPALFVRGLFDELGALSGQQGAKKVILRHLESVRRVPFPAGAFDLDTPQDVTRHTACE
jgi:molybdenum cofactor cytidylyltransferase